MFDKLIEFIEEERAKRNMTISAFAELCDCSISMMSSVINKTRQPGLDFLYGLARGTNTDLGIIIGLIFPNAVNREKTPEQQLLIDRISRLSPDDIRLVDALVYGLALKQLKDRGKDADIDSGEDSD